MNEARETYLKNYSAVGKIDQMLLHWDLSYKSWRWWHAPTRHAKAIAMSMAYSSYLQCAKGTVDPEWKVTPVSKPRFCQKMSLQMVQYKSSNLHYPGDEKMRNTTTQMKKRKRGTSEVGVIQCEDHVKRVSYAQYLDEKQPRGAKKTRICARNMMLLKGHLISMKRVHPSSCQMCGKKTYMEFQVCKKRVCFKSGKNMTSLSCSIDFHDDLMYGLGFMDCVELFGVKKSQFNKANAAEVKKNKIHMKKRMTKYEEDTEDTD
jgi:hypothetical protein